MRTRFNKLIDTNINKLYIYNTMGRKIDRNFEPIKPNGKGKKSKNASKEYEKKKDKYFQRKRDAKNGINELNTKSEDYDE